MDNAKSSMKIEYEFSDALEFISGGELFHIIKISKQYVARQTHGRNIPTCYQKKAVHTLVFQTLVEKFRNNDMLPSILAYAGPKIAKI